LQHESHEEHDVCHQKLSAAVLTESSDAEVHQLTTKIHRHPPLTTLQQFTFVYIHTHTSHTNYNTTFVITLIQTPTQSRIPQFKQYNVPQPTHNDVSYLFFTFLHECFKLGLGLEIGLGSG